MLPLQTPALVASGKPEQRANDAATDGDDLEQFTHLVRQQHLVDGAAGTDVIEGARLLSGQQVEDTAVEQELALAEVAEQIESGRIGGGDDCREIDVDRDILQAREIERIGMRMMAVMTHQGPAPALLMVELAAREAVVDQQQRSALQTMAPFSGPGTCCKADLVFVTRRQGALRTDLSGGRQQWTRRWSLVPGETACLINPDTALEDTIFAPSNDMGRHRVEQFVGQDDPREGLRQTIQPADTGQQVRRGGG